MDSGFSPQRSITASRRSVVFEIACLHNRNNKHRLTFCHVAFANLCSSRRHHRADRVARRALCEILASRYYHRRVQGAAFEVTVETGSCRRSLAALSLTRLAPTLSRAQVLLDRDMPNPATMKLYHEELQAMVLAVDSELPALHETVETLKRKREACTETFKELVDCRTGCKTCHKDKMADPKYARSAAHQKRAMHNCSHVSCEGGAACVMPTRKRAIRSVVVAAHARVCVCWCVSQQFTLSERQQLARSVTDAEAELAAANTKMSRFNGKIKALLEHQKARSKSLDGRTRQLTRIVEINQNMNDIQRG